MTQTYCVNHPETETRFACMKHEVYLCEDCLACRDPDIYCKFRTSCPIWFLTKRKGDLDGDATEIGASGNSDHAYQKAQTG